MLHNKHKLKPKRTNLYELAKNRYLRQAEARLRNQAVMYINGHAMPVYGIQSITFGKPSENFKIDEARPGEDFSMITMVDGTFKCSFKLDPSNIDHKKLFDLFGINNNINPAYKPILSAGRVEGIGSN